MRALAIALLVLVLAVPLVWRAAVSAQPNPLVSADLSSYEETPSTLSTAGRGTFRAKVTNEIIEYELSYENLQGATTSAAHIHLGRAGTTGGVIAFLCGGGGKPACTPTSGSFSGTIVPADVIGPAGQGIAAGEFEEVVRAIFNGAVYANVHTNLFPGGEIRGQVSGVMGQ